MIVTGSYKGRTATIKCRIRGANTAGGTDPFLAGDLDGTNYSSLGRTPYSCGISEAFNKHVIYADTIAGSGNVRIKGNITYRQNIFTGSLTSDSEATWTETTNVSLPWLPLSEIPVIPPASDFQVEDVADPKNDHPNTDIFWKKRGYLQG